MARVKGSSKTSGSGRKKGTPNKASAKREAEVAESGKTPLQFLLDRMRNAKADMAERLNCAKAAAPYVHPKLESVEHRGDGGGPLVIEIVRFSDAHSGSE